jgi:hypothetical protein
MAHQLRKGRMVWQLSSRNRHPRVGKTMDDADVLHFMQ